jgi:ferredoxin-NADP reductase
MKQPTRTLTVLERTEVAADTITLTLGADPESDLAAWQPGAHIDLVLPDGTVRQYSLCSDHADSRRWRIGVLREKAGRGGSDWIHAHLTAGGQVEVSAPRNHFALVPAPRYRFIAGGIGITPILAMLREAQQQGAAWTLLYGGRSLETMAFQSELAAYGEQVRLWPQDQYGLLDLADFLREPADGELLYACGPEPMLQAVEAASVHWPDGALHVERFVPKVIEHPADGTFEVEFVESGMTATVTAEQTILDIAEERGLNVFSSCREGTCGTCETPVLEGEIDHRDSLLTPAEQARNDTMLICVSRAAPGCPRLRLAL